MKKFFFVLVALSALNLTSFAQTKVHKLVFDLASGDTSTHATVIRQLNNILKADPNAELEVVCHGKAVYMLVAGKENFENAMQELKNRAKVSFKACANSMRRYGIDKTQLVSLAEVVPVAMLELADKQAEGWSYIKAGE